MLSDLRKKKLGRLFTVLDSDHDGILQKSDYARVVSNLAKMNSWPSDAPEYTALENLYQNVWGNLQTLADVDNDGEVTFNEFLDFHAQMLATREMYQTLTAGTLDLLFNAFDRNRNGSLSRIDFGELFEAYGISD